MTGTILDLVQAEVPPGKKGFMETAKRAPSPKEDSFLNDIADYAKTIVKGGVEGLSRFGRMMGPLQGTKSTEEQLSEQTESLDELLPTDEGFAQKSIRRGLKQAPTAMSFPGSQLASGGRAILAGTFGQTAEELGAPEWAQTAAEITAYLGPDVTRKLLEKGKNSDLISSAKKMGMTDEQITPLIQSDFKQKWLSKLSPKGASIEAALKSTKEGISSSYDLITKNDFAQNAKLSPHWSQKLETMFDKLFKEMPVSVRNKIMPDYQEFKSGEKTLANLTNLYKDVNHELGPSSKQLSTLKVPIKEAIKEVSPMMAKDFDIINDLNFRYHKIASKLKPTMGSEVVSAAKPLAYLMGILTGNYNILYHLGTHEVASKVAKQLIFNPRFQQLSNKVAIAAQQGSFPIIMKSVQEIRKLLKGKSPEAAEELENISEEDLRNLFLNHPTQEMER